jgi:hypothetical protein
MSEKVPRIICNATPSWTSAGLPPTESIRTYGGASRSGQVGAPAAREVSRFARNSREWQQVVDVCRVVDTVLIDQEMVYGCS